MTEVKADIIYT